MKVLVLGGQGQVGKCLQEIRPDWVYWGREDCDLLDYQEVHAKIQAFCPNVIINLAAMVGGIQFNINHQESMFDVNVRMGLNVLSALKAVRQYRDCRIIQILSSCMYPAYMENETVSLNKNPYPMEESVCENGYPEKTNLGYALSKRIIKQAIDFNRSLGYNDCYLIPCNLMSEHDNFNVNSSHLIAALIRKVCYAKENGIKEIENYGDGTPLRQFMHADDLAYVISQWVRYNINTCVNVAGEENLSVKELTNIVLDVCDANHLKVKWGGNLNGVHRKDISTKLLKSEIEWNPLSVRKGVEKIYDKFK